MFGKKKKTLGFKPKLRTRTEINEEYQSLALNVGHKGRMIRELENEINVYTARMIEISHEASKLPPDPVAPVAPIPSAQPQAEFEEHA